MSASLSIRVALSAPGLSRHTGGVRWKLEMARTGGVMSFRTSELEELGRELYVAGLSEPRTSILMFVSKPPPLVFIVSVYV